MRRLPPVAKKRERWLQLEAPLGAVWFRWAHCSPWFCVPSPEREHEILTRTTRMVEARNYDLAVHGVARDAQPDGAVLLPHNAEPGRTYWAECRDGRWRAVVCGDAATAQPAI